MTQEEARTYVKESAEVHEFAAEIARIISGIPQMPEFSNEKLTVEDVSKMTGFTIPSIRAGIVHGWLPIGTAVRNNKIVTSQTKDDGRTEYLVSPRKLWEELGYVWKGKAALNK